MNTFPHGCNLRKGRFSETGRIYLITSVTYKRMPVFSDMIIGRMVVRELMKSDNHQWSDTLAFVIMPDHLHWLFQLTGIKPIETVVGSIKRHAARAMNQSASHHGRKVWQRGFHDHAIRREENIRQAARYIVYNPVRAGLVERIEDYPLWHTIWV